jgi:hypothetical protein
VPSRRRLAAVVALVVLTGCGADGADRGAVERAVGETFAHRWAATAPGPTPRADQAGATATCASASGAARGAGDWSCALSWVGLDGLAHTAEYDLQVSADGCFRAAQQVLGPAVAGAGPAGFDGCTRGS